MIGFLIKKNFFDLWDNLIRIILVNIGFIAFMSFPVFIPPLFASLPLLGGAFALIGILWCFVYLSAAALSFKAVSDYGSFGFADFINNLKIIWPAGLLFGAIVYLAYLLCSVVIPFYLGMNSTIGLFLAAIIFWTLILAVLALQFFFAVRVRLDTKFVKVIKKCFIIFFDNPKFCIFTFAHNFFILGLAGLATFLFPGPAGMLLFLVPGPAGMVLFLDESLRLRLLKYDWLEVNPGANRRQIPWDAILIDEREKTGDRSLKSFIFPWKD